jgi:8-oxo-dGTP pyrophosphatase MutT (NUDIX family)
MIQNSIKPVAVCIFRKENAILVREGHNPSTNERFFQPLGGSLRFGEYSWEAIRREIRNELGEEIKNLTFIGPAEEVTRGGERQDHEILFLFEGEFENPASYQKPVLVGQTGEGTTYQAVWKPIKDFRRKKVRLYPEGLLDFLK